MTVKERGFARMSEDVEATIWRLRETIRVAEFVATHRLGQMRRLLTHEKHKAWKREFGFDRIETAAEMDEKRFRISTSPVPYPFFCRNMVIPRRAPIHRTNSHWKWKWMSKACGWKSFSRNPRRHSVIHRRDAPRSIRSQRNPERRDSRPRSVRDRRNPEHREPLLKPV